jgi:hypothetical protein
MLGIIGHSRRAVTLQPIVPRQGLGKPLPQKDTLSAARNHPNLKGKCPGNASQSSASLAFNPARISGPCLVISPDEMSRHIDTVIVASMTTKGRPYPTRGPVRFHRP